MTPNPKTLLDLLDEAEATRRREREELWQLYELVVARAAEPHPNDGEGLADLVRRLDLDPAKVRADVVRALEEHRRRAADAWIAEQVDTLAVELARIKRRDAAPMPGIN